MEYNLPPVVSPEHFPEPEAPARKKSRWNIFEAFRKKDAESEPTPPSTPEVSGVERSPDAPKKRRFGETIIRLLRGERPAPEAKRGLFMSPAEQQEPVMPRPPERIVRSHAERQPEQPVDPEQTPEGTSLIERAQEMGRGVLRLLNKVKREVIAADKREHVPVPTDIQPLAAADERMRAAMQELIAPIEAYAAEKGIALPSETAAVPEALAPTNTGPDPVAGGGGGDRSPQLTVNRSRMFETAAAVAATAAELVADKAERPFGRRQRLGLFAVGAATVGVLIYTWHRQREIGKKQKALKQEHEKFEKEVRDYQREERRRIEALEKVEVASLSQAQRQEHVHEVSRFAFTQAEAIHTVAQHQKERLQVRAARPTIKRPVMAAPPQLARPQQPETLQPFVVPVETPKAEQALGRDPFVPAEAPRRTFLSPEGQRPEKRTVIERAMEALNRPKTPSTTEGSGGLSGLGGFAHTLIGLTTGTSGSSPAEEPVTQQTNQPLAPPRRSGQEWLLGIGLALGVAGVLLLLIGVL